MYAKLQQEDENMYQLTVDLLNSMTKEKQQELIEILKDKAKIPQSEEITLKDLLIKNFGEDEEDVYNALVDEVEIMNEIHAPL
jgi:peroxiredoxin family protein